MWFHVFDCLQVERVLAGNFTMPEHGGCSEIYATYQELQKTVNDRVLELHEDGFYNRAQNCWNSFWSSTIQELKDLDTIEYVNVNIMPGFLAMLFESTCFCYMII